MARRDLDIEEDEGPFVSAGYSKVLRSALKTAKGRRKLTDDEVGKRAGVGRTTLWRVVRGDRVKLSTVRVVVETLAELSGDDLPPPFVLVQGFDHHLWCEIGARLELADPVYFGSLLKAAGGGVASPLREPLQKRTAAIRKLRRKRDAERGSPTDTSDE